MADNDKWLKCHGSQWSKAYKVATGCGAAWEVAASLPEGISKLLRGCGGLADFNAFAEILEPFFGVQHDLFGSDAVTAEDECERVARERCGAGLQSQFAETLHSVARGVLLQTQMEGPLEGSARQEFAQRALSELVCAQFVDRLNLSKAFNERFDKAAGGDAILSAQMQSDFCEAVRGELPVQLKKLALGVARDASGATLPTCRKRMPKRSLLELTQIDISI